MKPRIEELEDIATAARAFCEAQRELPAGQFAYSAYFTLTRLLEDQVPATIRRVHDEHVYEATMEELRRERDAMLSVVGAAIEWSEAFTGTDAFDALESAVDTYKKTVKP